MNFKLVDSGWDTILDSSLRSDHSQIRVICPFIKERAARRLIQYGRPKLFQVITRFDLDGFLQGASDISALKCLRDSGAQIRGIRNLHAKTYLIGSRAVVTSANLTEQALRRNHEFGFVSEDSEVVAECRSYFERLWGRAGSSLSDSQVGEWETKISNYLASGAGSRIFPKLGDDGTNVDFSPIEEQQPNWLTAASQGFVKFFGEGHNRLEKSFPILEEVKRAGCHWACTYPQMKRPRSVQDGAIMFMGRLVERPNDILIFGRAIGMKYVEGRDDATAADISKRGWKAQWPRYIRVHDAEFVSGSLEDGVSLNELMEKFGSNSFASTKRNLEARRAIPIRELLTLNKLMWSCLRKQLIG